MTGAWWLDTANSRVWVYDNTGGATSKPRSERTLFPHPAAIRISRSTDFRQRKHKETESLTAEGGSGCSPMGSAITTGRAAFTCKAQSLLLQSLITPTDYNGDDGVELYDTPGMLIYGVTANYNVQQPAALYLAGIKWDPSSGSLAPVVEYSNACYNGIAQPRLWDAQPGELHHRLGNLGGHYRQWLDRS